MINTVKHATQTLTAMPVWAHIGATAAVFAGFQGVKAALDASYAASKHPVDFMTGQLAFSAEKIEGYYSVMQNAGTLNIYLRTQIIDFGFILSVALLGLCLGSLLGRIGPVGGIARKVGLGVALLACTGAALDAAENLLSFGMLMRPETIPTGLAIMYSGVAAAKFACLVPAVFGAGATALIGFSERALNVLRGPVMA
ncbi:MAG: hypothetical protein ACRBCL_09505 [Maritimibacter sp.]